MSDTISNPNPSHWNALKKIVKCLPANLAYYGSALGAIVLAGGGQLPLGLEFVAGSIGGNMLSNVISDILKDEKIPDEEIRQRAEEAIHKSDIVNLLTKQDFLQGYARLIQRLDAQKTISQDILDELRTGFSKVATADQVEELKRLILQLMQQPPQTAARKVRLFISYARADDEPFVGRLYHDLKDEFDVWWDRETMSNRGKTFLQEIRDAIDHADRLLLVAGPRAFTSDYVRDEWQYAYETYKGINIALRLGDYTDFPAQLSGFDAPDFRGDANYNERLVTLKRQLVEPVAPIGAFHNVPALPPHFLNRPEALDALRELIIADVDKPTLISAEKRTTAVEGMGGIGKSVLAAAFAHDRKVRFAFPDGIVWLTAGRDAKLYELYRAVGIALGDDLSNYPDETTARQNAQKAIAEKKCLLILDDLWELPVGHAFRDLISGTVTRLLITTRNLQINDLLNANEYRLKLIDESQAADYLRSWAGDDPKLDEIAGKLGYLFLALKLAGARMKKDNLSGTDYLRSFDRVSRMKIDRNATDRDSSLEVSIMLSVNAVFMNIEDDRLLYHTFGIFQEDTSIPQQTILQLWKYLRPDVDEFDLLETLNALVDLALVERHEDRTITLHDLLHSYTREKLGDRYIQTHQDLLDSYGVDEWDKLSKAEPYLWWHLAFHLIESENQNVLYSLLLNFRYLKLKIDITDINSLILDYTLFKDKYDLQVIRSALELSTSIIHSDSKYLSQQLVCRLMSFYKKISTIRDFIDHVMRNVSGLYPIDLESKYYPLNQAGGSLKQILAGHKDDVWGATELSNQRILTWSTDGTLRLWTNGGEPIKELNGHNAWVRGAVELPDRRILSWAHEIGGEDHTLRLWSENGKPLKQMIGHTRSVRGVLLLKDGKIVSWAGNDRGKDHTLRLWGNEGEPIAFLNRHKDGINGALQLKNGDFAVWSGKEIRIWSTSGKWVLRLLGHSNTVMGVCELDGKIYSWSKDGTLRLWENTGEKVKKIVLHRGDLRGLYFLDESKILSWGEDNVLYVWNHDGTIFSQLVGHTGKIRGAIELTDKRILSWGEDDVLYVWNHDGTIFSQLVGHTGKIRGAIELTDKRILSWANDKTPLIWMSDLQSCEESTGHKARIQGLLGLSNGKVVSWAGEHRNPETVLRLWDSNGRLIKDLIGHEAQVNGAIELRDQRILSWSQDRTLRLWNENGEFLKTLTSHVWDIEGVVQLADGRILSFDNHFDSSYCNICLWNEEGDLLNVLEHWSWLGGKSSLQDWKKVHDVNSNEIDHIIDSYIQHPHVTLSNEIEVDGYKFAGDADISSFMSTDDALILGDLRGRVIFLQKIRV